MAVVSMKQDVYKRQELHPHGLCTSKCLIIISIKEENVKMFFQKILDARAAIFLQRCSCRKKRRESLLCGRQGHGSQTNRARSRNVLTAGAKRAKHGKPALTSHPVNTFHIVV